MKIRVVGAQFFQTDGKMEKWTDGQTEMATVIVISRKFYERI